MRYEGFRKKQASLAVLLSLILLAGCAEAATGTPDKAQIVNEDTVAVQLREGVKAHAKELTVRFTASAPLQEDIEVYVKRWMEAAFMETTSPKEGDYLRYQYGGYEVRSLTQETGEGTAYEIVIVPTYYNYLFEAEEADALFDAWFAAVLPEDEVRNGTLSEEKKVARIYDAVCRSVHYDKVHAGRANNTLRSTMYSALHYHSATCQGYCVLLYRALRTAGINCRIVSGTALGEYHTWNLAEVDGRFYALDATWDAGQETYSYYLKGSRTMRASHQPDVSFTTAPFTETYALSEDDFFPAKENGSD